VLIEVNCETDFVARTDEFQKLVRDLAIQVAGLSPRWVSLDDVPDEAIEVKRQELAGDPGTRGDVESHVKRWLKEAVLLEQPFRDSSLTVGELVTDRVATIGENIRVRRFVRYALGEDG
jgi:elongation factor Ts